MHYIQTSTEIIYMVKCKEKEKKNEYTDTHFVVFASNEFRELN